MDFSVVIPLFNKEPHVLEAVMSALAQSHSPREVIIVDDGSSDGSLTVVRAITDARVRILTRSPPGPGGYAARNLGIKQASGEWIAFLDADDIWHPHHLADLRESIDATGGAVGCAFSRFDIREPGKDRTYPMAERYLASGRVLSLEDILRAWLNTGCCPLWTGASAFRRELLIDVGMFPAGRARRGGDKDTWLRAVALAPVAFAPRCSAEFRLDGVNRVSNSTAHVSPPIILQTIAALLRTATPSQRQLLRRLANQEITQYARHAAGAGSIVGVDFLRNLYLPDGLGALSRIVAYQLAASVRRCVVQHLR